jgi:hypothetical protein
MIVYQNPHYLLTRTDLGLYYLVRTSEPFRTVGEAKAQIDAILHATRRVRPSGLIVDLRQARPRDDPEFEEVAAYRRRMFMAAPQVAVLVRSKIGLLQVGRHIREDGVADRAAVFDDETEAREWLVARQSGRPPVP